MTEIRRAADVEVPVNEPLFLIVYRHLGPLFPPAIHSLYRMTPELTKKFEQSGGRDLWTTALLNSLQADMAKQLPEFASAIFYAVEFTLDDLGEFANYEKIVGVDAPISTP